MSLKEGVVLISPQVGTGLQQLSILIVIVAGSLTLGDNGLLSSTCTVKVFVTGSVITDELKVISPKQFKLIGLSKYSKILSLNTTSSKSLKE